MYKEDENVIQFLKQYEKICNLYGYQICACGCCNSPYLNNLVGNYEIEDIEMNNEILQFTLIAKDEFDDGYLRYTHKKIEDLEEKCKEYYKKMEENNENI